MKEQTPSPKTLSFGVFRLDLETGHLRKNGRRLRLQEQPFQVLSMLLERPGQVVTREELQQKLWSADTFVDFDHGLNKAINKIRRALGDSADNPRFVETLARRGYRFIAPVESVSDSDLAADAVDNVGKTSTASRRSTELQDLQVQRRRWTAGWICAAVALALILAGAGWYYFDRSRSLPPMTVVRFTSYPGIEKDPALSPDGKRLAFVWDGESGDNFDVYVRSIGPVGELPLTAEKPPRLTTDPAPDLSPTWSPDGRYLAFARVSEGNSAVYVVPSMGGQERKLVEFYSIWSEFKTLDWSPDGKSLLAAAKSSPGDPYSLYSLSPDTGDAEKLTSPLVEFGGDVCPAFSPDGQTLAFTRVVAYSDVYLMRLNHRDPKLLTANMSGGSSAWTADGREIVFVSRTGSRRQLSRVSISDKKKPQALGIEASGTDPTIARQGNRLAYVEPSYDTDIWKIEVASSHDRAAQPTKLVLNSSQEDFNPQHSPDGKSIVFGSNRSGSYEIWVCDSEGQNARPLTSFPEASITASPRWSPDGRRIAFDSWDKGRSNVFVVSPEGGTPRCLTEQAADAFLPSWSKDGRWIYFCANRSGDNQIWRMPAEGGEAARVTKKGGFESLVSPDGKTLYYTKLNWAGPTSASAHLWKVPVEGGEERLVFERAIDLRYWAVTEQGVYFVPSDWHSNPRIEFFSFATGQVSKAVTLQKPPIRHVRPGLSISPDGRWILCALVEQDTSDIMLVENFR
ncbi:MAG: winged helix-turn-helix domain-containing protein [Acidobacteriota bacterium]